MGIFDWLFGKKKISKKSNNKKDKDFDIKGGIGGVFSIVFLLFMILLVLSFTLVTAGIISIVVFAILLFLLKDQIKRGNITLD